MRLRNGLTIAEVALAVTLVCGAALLTRSLVKLNRIDAGVDTGRVLTMRLTLPVERYRGAAIHQFFEQLVTRVRSLPGVQDAGVASQFPPSAPLRAQFRMDGPGGGTTLPRAAVTAVSKEALDTLRVPLIGGRSFDAGDRADTPLVAIVNETFARQQAENGRALGRTIRIGAADRLSPPFEIVGISRDTRNQGLRVPPGPEIFIPLAQQTVNNQLYLIVRAEGEPTSLLPALRHEIAALDPEQPIYAIQTLDEAFADETFRERASAVVLVAFAGIGLALAAIGIYGLMAFTVSTRRREIAVRMSLGADAGAVRAAIVGRGMRLVGIGAAAGIGVSLVVGRMMRGILYGVTAADPVSLLAMLAIVTLAGLAACLAPARRATAIDPASALRDGL